MDAFNTSRYLEKQLAAFDAKMQASDQPLVIEFGGKPFGDYHAARVLPGYNPDVKADILHNLANNLGNVSITMAVNAQDILANPDGRRNTKRIRGDTGLRYDEESIRLVHQARDEFNIPVNSITMAVTPDSVSDENAEYIERFGMKVRQNDIDFAVSRKVPNYPVVPQTDIIRELTTTPALSTPDQHSLILSPGGGSGKFGVAISEIAHKLVAGGNPNFVKFETFPVFKLPMDHPLNLAFLAATADLPNELLRTQSGLTNYDKDVENLALLQTLLAATKRTDSPMHAFKEPTDMGVNVIERGITDMDAVADACHQEIIRRCERYISENSMGDEGLATIARTEQYLQALNNNRGYNV